MSRAIRIKVSETVSRVVHVNDGLCAPVELLPILPVEKMREALKSALRQQGFTIEGDMATFDLGDGVTAEVDTVAGKVTLKAEHEEKIEAKIEREVFGDTDYGREDAQRAKAVAEARKDGEAKIAKEEEAKRAAMTTLLESKLPLLKEIMDKAVNRTTMAALEEKARSMGQVESIDKTEDGNSMSIKVKI